jgi:hypothetical protein
MIYIYTATFIKIFKICCLINPRILIKYESEEYLKLENQNEINTSCRQSESHARDSAEMCANIYEGTGLTHHNKHIQHRAKQSYVHGDFVIL